MIYLKEYNYYNKNYRILSDEKEISLLRSAWHHGDNMTTFTFGYFINGSKLIGKIMILSSEYKIKKEKYCDKYDSYLRTKCLELIKQVW